MNKKKLTAVILCAATITTIFTGCGTSKSGFAPSNDITVISREDGSGTRGAFIELVGVQEKGSDGKTVDKTTKDAVVANETNIVMTNVQSDIYGIGYISLGSLNSSVKAISVDGIKPTADNVKSQAYKISRPFNIATKDGVSEAAQDFISYIMSADGQKIVSANGYIPVNDTAGAYTKKNAAGKITVAGSSSVTPVMEKLKEGYLAQNPGMQVEIQMSDSTTGMTAALNGVCDIGMASRELKDSEKSLKATAIALDGIAMIVNNSNPITNISKDNIKKIYTGTTTKWQDVK